jgi:hypothetical protein
MQETLLSNSPKKFRRFTGKSALAMTLAMAVASIATMPAAHAGGNSSKNTEHPGNIVSHVALAGGSVTRMLLVKRNGKEYLVLGLGSSEQVTMMDVSDPRRPQALDSAAAAPGKPGAELNVVAGILSVFGKSDATTPASADPEELHNISGVTSFVIDAPHGLIYAASNDGLWIVKTRRQANEDARPDYYGG